MRVHAHEYWVQAEDFNPSINSVVSLQTMVGSDFIGEDVPNIADFYSDYSVLSAQGRFDVLGNLATTPPAYFTPDTTGTYIIGQRTNHQSLELEPDDFRKYLRKQGLDQILPHVKNLSSGRNEKLIQEKFSRCAKAIVQTKQAGDDSVLSEPLGYTLEIIPLSNPQGLLAGEEFTMQLLYKSQPLQGAQVMAMLQSQAENATHVRTDHNGIARFKLHDAGQWMFSAVHMIPYAGADARWESFWANLRFELKK